jgi:hypothetical protein
MVQFKTNLAESSNEGCGSKGKRGCFANPEDADDDEMMVELKLVILQNMYKFK